MATNSEAITCLVVCLCLSVLLAGCNPSSPKGAADPGAEAAGTTKPPKRGRVLLIGVDGVSPKVVIPLMKKGHLQNMASLARQGVFGPLRSEHPLYSPRIWNSIATGKDPEEHGITAFVHQDEEGKKHLYMSYDRKVPALWNIISASDHSIGIVNWWTTYPPEKINGVMVSDHFFPEQSEMIRTTFKDESDISGALVYPTEWTDRALAARNDDTPLSDVEDPFVDNDALSSWINRPLLSAQYATDGQVTRTALAIDDEYQPDVLVVFLPGVDRVSHWLWGTLEPDEKYPAELRPTPTARAAGAKALFDYYAYIDDLIGQLMERYGEDDLVVILSDHGFEAQVSLMLLTGGHETEESIDGVLFARGPDIPKNKNTGKVSVLDVTPTILAWLGIPHAEDMRGQPMAFLEGERLAPVASYDDLTVERVDVGHAGAEDEIVEHLRALGYLEGDGVDMDEERDSSGARDQPATP